MGLDMYIYRKDKDGHIENVAYWRKANQIHKWFVENVQHGIDKCEPHEVTQEDLMDLCDLCLKAIETKDASLLPPQSGFFFGSTNIDEFYWSDINETVALLNNIIDSQDWDNNRFYYRSSW